MTGFTYLSTQPPLAAFDWNPALADLLDRANAVQTGSTDTEITVKLQNGLHVHVTGTGFTFSEEGNLVDGTVTGIEIRDAPDTASIVRVGDFSRDAAIFFDAITGMDSTWTFQNWLSLGDDTITGADGDDDLEGYDGNDTISGGAGWDYVDGGRGDDTLDGGTGQDGERDTLSYQSAIWSSGALHGVTINVAAGTAIDPWDGHDTIQSFEEFRGTQFADSMTGSDGDETFEGFGGRDVFDGAGGTDTLSYRHEVSKGGFRGVEIHLEAQDDATGTGWANDTFGTRDTFKSIENVQGSGLDDKIFGSAGNNKLEGEEGNDTIFGNAGKDVLSGWTGNDKLYGGTEEDALIGAAGDDLLDGGEGDDDMQGGAGNDTYVVDSANDNVDEANEGGSGTDTVQAYISYSLVNGVHLLGVVENLTLIGADNTSATGNAVANRLVGNGGNNRLDGGLGNDKLTGGAGKDSFVFSTKLNASANIDHITDFYGPDDTFELDHKIFSKLKTGNLAANAFVANTSGTATHATDRIVYNSANGKLYYDADGNGSGAAMLIAVLDNHAKLAAADFHVF
nr:calcium-binding protein [uncultured Gellertiella sp.]